MVLMFNNVLVHLLGSPPGRIGCKLNIKSGHYIKSGH
jgi:hypothetical protein